MGPFDPPMVTAQGYNSPMTAPAPDQNAMIAELLRRRSAAAKQAQMSAGNAEMWNNTIGQPHFTQTVDGGRNQPDQVVVNWGDILGKGVSNYMGAKERKTAIEKTDEVKQLNNDFMQHTLSNDPMASKLYGAVQAGVPGADKALMDHMAPKKQTLADLTQFISAGGSPAMAAEIAKSKGVDPEIAFRAAQYQSKTAEEKRASAFADKSTLLDQQIQGKKDIEANKPTKTGYTQAELAAMPIEQRLAAVQASTGRESAESKARGKMKVQAEQELPQTDYAMQNINRVIDLAKKADYWPGNLGLKADKATTNTNNVNLRQALAQLTLDANGGKLGAGFSNADRDFMREAQTNLEAGNMNTVTYQLGQLVERLKRHQKTLRKNAGIPEPAPDSSTFDEDWGAVGGQ